MRRRQIFAAQAAAAEQGGDIGAYLASYPTPEALQTAIERTRAESPRVAAAPPPPPGTCPKCGKHVGRGIAVHIRSCRGAS